MKKIKRAKSINPRAERIIRKLEWKKSNFNYSESHSLGCKISSYIISIISALLISISVLVPYHFLMKDIDTKANNSYFTDGFKYTINAVIPDSFFEWVVNK